jgi:hypothetical protein
MTGGTSDTIRERAYRIWEREGRPAGRAEQHWAQAEHEIANELDAAAHTDLRPGGANQKEESALPDRHAERGAKSILARRR